MQNALERLQRLNKDSILNKPSKKLKLVTMESSEVSSQSRKAVGFRNSDEDNDSEQHSGAKNSKKQKLTAFSPYKKKSKNAKQVRTNTHK